MAIRRPAAGTSTLPGRPKWQSRYHGVRMTPEEYLALPEEKPYLEYIDGMVVQKPTPQEEHVELVAELIHRLKLWMKTHKGRVGPEARAKLGELPNYRLPDVSHWKPGIARGNEAPPTLAVEVRSPDQTMAELRRKCEYLREGGVEVCWLIDPASRTAEVFDETRRGVQADILSSPALPEFELAVRDLFAVLDEE